MARILVVEDEPLISAMLEDWLTELGHEAIGPAASVPDALGLIGESAFDAAILDINLRAQRCDPVAQVLSERGVPFAFTTGSSADAVDRRFADSPTITKPYDFEGIERIVGSLLSRVQEFVRP